jgi:hypothetical protein
MLRLSNPLLFTAPHAGAYTCQLTAGAGDPVAGYHLTAVPYETTFSVSDDMTGAQWWQNPDCESDGTLNCKFLGSPGDPAVWEIFRNDGTPTATWTAPAGATTADASATVMVTSCYHGTGSCPSSHWGAENDKSPAVVNSFLGLSQLNADGSVCTSRTTPGLPSIITGEAHHYPINYYLPNVPISSNCTSRRFVVRVATSWQGGVPVKIDGTRPDTMFPVSASNAIVTTVHAA